VPYDGSGTFTVINSFTPSTTILSSPVNANNVDFATGFTTALPRDGQAAMTGGLRIVDGSEALPGMRFADDTNTGFRRSAADVMEWVAGGADRMFIDADGKAWFLGALDVVGLVNLQAVLTLINTGLHILDTNASHDLIIKPNSDLTADRTLSLVTGDADRSVTIQGDVTLPAGTPLVQANNLSDVAVAATAFGNIKQAASDTATGAVEIAVQAEMEAAASALLAVTPGRQHFHPGHPKAWGRAQGDGTLDTSYNIASVVHTATGIYTVTLTTAMADTLYAVVVGGFSSTNARIAMLASITSSTVFVVHVRSLSEALIDASFNFVVFGDT
jgi:hypothetical protein